jgi:hypothetical protein
MASVPEAGFRIFARGLKKILNFPTIGTMTIIFVLIIPSKEPDYATPTSLSAAKSRSTETG